MDPSVKEKLEKFFSQYSVFKFKKGEILIRADEKPAGVFFLKEGVVKRYAISPKGEELTLNIFRPIAFFPMEYVINSSLNHHYFEAISSLTITKAPKEDFLKFIKKEPEVLLDLVSRVYRGLEGLLLRMEYLLIGGASKRLINELLIFARRFGKGKGQSIVINLRLTEKDLASQSGIARETVSRELQKLKDKNLLTYKKGTLIINDLFKLEQELL